MSNFLPARWLAVLPALAAFASSAQTDPAPDSAVATETSSALAFRSAMEGYQPFGERKPVPWKEANDIVRQRGGWQAYAKEGTAAPDEKPSGASDPHAGHAKPSPAAPAPEEKP
ncbi:hypothetical protein H4CHR_05173 [Variovorax sp. PBS-H4]|uniref:hypothetical protein n=1 Tax=Variovorax sp. PBS-H4 TaxID=434008 RepID=UPI00131742BD|nr:hypothetical protein [Variovorax sp. PBS-H4]VTU40453.1 hypothetical protein H4CHR_05173 [Variovorax sp. PBS-H4]